MIMQRETSKQKEKWGGRSGKEKRNHLAKLLNYTRGSFNFKLNARCAIVYCETSKPGFSITPITGPS